MSVFLKKLFTFKKFSQFCIVEEIKQQIITKALESFVRYGFKAVTVDEIANTCGISKKTLYSCFKDKQEIVRAALNAFDQEMRDNDQLIHKSAGNAIEEVALLMQMMEARLSGMNPNCFTDLQRYYPKALHDFTCNKETHVVSLLQNIKRGIKEGYYRKGLNVDLVANFRFETMFYFITNNTTLSQFNFLEVQMQQMQLFLYGICTVQGHELIDKYINKLKKKKL